MKILGLMWTAACFCLVTGLYDDDNAKDEAIKKERKMFVGTWRVISLEVNGNKAKEEDFKKMKVVNGLDGTWSLQVEGRDVWKGTSQINPSKKPKTIDFTPSEGEDKDRKFL